MEILAIIPARGGSKGLVGKNIKILDGKPLIAYTIEAALKSKWITRVIVNTDDVDIAKVSKDYKAEVPFLRDGALATDEASIIEVIRDCLTKLAKEAYYPDYICLLQCTSPLRNENDIDRTIDRCFATGSDGCMALTEVDDNPYWTHQIKDNKIEYFIPEGASIQRRQDLPPIYKLNGSVYFVKTSSFLEEGKIEISNATGYVMPKERSVDIDTYIDFKMAEWMLQEMKG